MKSAFDRAMERAEKLGTLSPEELKRLDSLPRGNLIAARYLREDNNDLEAELTKLKGTGVRKYIIEGAQEIFLRNIALPRDIRSKQTARRAMAGLQFLKENKKALNGIVARLEQLFNYYEQARQQSFNQLKQDFEARMNEKTGGLGKRLLGGKSKINIEGQPEFQEEWYRAQASLDQQYEKALEDQRKEIVKLS
ncbi:MAG: hypothetical protein Q8P00_02720 [Dehalococcoidia bacterium]|nr:hypothetical protein [Dehalococcoidia bacterium]